MLDSLQAAARDGLEDELQREARALVSSASLELAEGLRGREFESRFWGGGHKLSCTCLSVSPGGAVFTGSKDGTLTAWALELGDGGLRASVRYRIQGQPQVRRRDCRETLGHAVAGVKPNRHPYCSLPAKGRLRKAYQQGHFGRLCALASDETYVATAGADCVINVRKAATGESLYTFVTDEPAASMYLRNGQLSFASGKNVRVLRIESGAQVYDLLGHTDAVSSVRPAGAEGEDGVTAGQDETVRYFDYYRQSQLIYECVGRVEEARLMRDDVIVACGAAGVLLINRKKKKPIFTFPASEVYRRVQAHWRESYGPRPLRFGEGDDGGVASGPGSAGSADGADNGASPTAASPAASALAMDSQYTCYCCAPIQGSDLLAVGVLGCVMLLRVTDDGIVAEGEVEVPGYISALEVTPLGGEYVLLAAIGQEPPTGRWDRVRCKPGLLAVRLGLPYVEKKQRLVSRFLPSGG